MTEICIGDVAASDFPSIPALLAQLGYPTDPDHIGRRVESILAAGGRVLVARSGETPLGLATVAFIPLVHHDDELCRITALVVAGHARGHGIGRQLVEAVERLALERGCLRLEVTSADHRAPAHAFYRNAGFSERPKRFVKHLRAAQPSAHPAAPPQPALARAADAAAAAQVGAQVGVQVSAQVGAQVGAQVSAQVSAHVGATPAPTTEPGVDPGAGERPAIP